MASRSCAARPRDETSGRGIRLRISVAEGERVSEKDYFETTRRASDKDFLVTPCEEPSAYFGGH
jgi:hypothetical protein